MPEARAMIGNIAPYLRLLREHPAFGELSEQALKTLVVRSDLIAFAPGELLLRQGEASDAALLIAQGEVEVLVETAQGEVQLGPATIGALLGEIGVFADLPRTASVRARTEAEALRMAREDVLQIGGENPAFLRAVMKQLGGRIAAFNRAIGFYTAALVRLERQDFDPATLDDTQQLPELVDFARTLRRIAERIGLHRPQSRDDQ